MIDKCEKCSVKIHWNNDVTPPPASNRAKQGKSGWFVEESGTLHTLDRCKSPTLSVGTLDYTFSLPTIEADAKMKSASRLVVMALGEANEIIKNCYPNLNNENLRGQIRSRLVDQLLTAYSF